MENPVICEDGITYEKSAIMEWLSKNKTSPITRKVISSDKIYPNIGIKKLIEEYKLSLLTEKKDNIVNDTNNTNNTSDIKYFGPIVNSTDIDSILNKINTKKPHINDFNEFLDKNKIGTLYDPMISQNIDYLNSILEFENSISKSFYIFAIINKLPKVIKWLRDINCVLSNDTINLAVVIGDKDLVNWVLDNNSKCDIYTLSYAITTEDTNFLSWLLVKGCFWGVLLEKHKKIIQNNKKIQKWCTDNNCIWNI